MSTLTPPPDEPMDPGTRARIAARLAEGTSAPEVSRLRPWLLPLGAAAAVLVIAFGVGYAAFWPGGDSALAPGADPTTSPSEVPAPTPTAGASPEDVDPGPTAVPSEVPEAQETYPAPTPTAGEAGPAGCAGAVAEQLDGAKQVATWELPKGTAGIWVAGERSVLCENSGGVVTAHGAQPVTSDGKVATESLRFSSSTYFIDRRQKLTAYVAGGPMPEGATGIDYLFPDGHEQRAEIRTDDAGRQWWVMAYVPYDGPMADPDSSTLDFDPVRVTVSLSGVQNEYTLQWARDDCAQVNHGC